ncbi:MAG: hypothetical protein M3Y08_02190 [Fibrobacterota bacterium]|nr:hypothetical protein [Fibrobacterota bacterium]
MSYFSSKSTWLSLVDSAGTLPREAQIPGSPAPALDGLSLSFEDFRPCLPAQSGDASPRDFTAAGNGSSDTTEDLDYLRITLELRHRLFFHFKEWEFGPALLEDHMRLAQTQTDPEEALVYYCQARHVAVTLVEKCGQSEFRLAWIETDRIISEVHALIGNTESSRVYAKAGLEAIKGGRWESDMDMRITKLAVRFLNLLDGK